MFVPDLGRSRMITEEGFGFVLALMQVDGPYHLRGWASWFCKGFLNLISCKDVTRSKTSW